MRNFLKFKLILLILLIVSSYVFAQDSKEMVDYKFYYKGFTYFSDDSNERELLPGDVLITLKNKRYDGVVIHINGKKVFDLVYAEGEKRGISKLKGKDVKYIKWDIYDSNIMQKGVIVSWDTPEEDIYIYYPEMGKWIHFYIH